MQNNKLDPYLYDDCDVLVNNLNIKDNKTLDEAESVYATTAIIKLRKEGYIIEDVYSIFNIHKILFEGIYSWAGNKRTITMYKKEEILNGCSVDYTPHEYIDKEMKDLNNLYKSIKWDKLDDNTKIIQICTVVAELWRIHCFREGNTRSVAMFLYFLLKQNNMHINIDFLGTHSAYFRNALVLASLYSASKPEYLLGIVKDITSISKTKNKYQSIEGYDVNKYKYSYHTIDKIKTIKNI